MSKPRKLIRTIRANAGVTARYRRRMMRLVDQMAASVEWFVRAQFRKTPPKMTDEVEQAQDARPPADFMRLRLGELRKRWERQFDDAANSIAEEFAERGRKASDYSFQQALKDAGWAVEFQMTPEMKDAMQASIGENVGLIRSIPAQYLDRVEGAVMRGYAAGRDLESMTKELRALYPISARRAALIARDQSNKLNATVNRARQLELGITRAVWMHSHAGKHPRASHVAADGKEYDVAKGCKIDGEYIQPGEKVGCRCTSRAVFPF